MTRQASIVEVDKVLVVAQRRCDDLGVSVKFDPYAETASTDGKHITLPYVGHPITKDTLDELYGFIIHECGHHLRPEAFKILRKAKPPAHLCSLFNIVEDDGMERERALAWRGDAKALGTMNALITQRVQKSWSEHTKGILSEGQDPAPMAALALGQLSRLVWDRESGPYVTSLIKSLPKEVQDLVTTLEHEGWVRKFRDTSTVLDTWDLSVDLAKRLYPDEDQDEYEQIKQAGVEAINDPKAQPRDDSKSSFKDAQGTFVSKGGGGTDSEGSGAGDDGRTISWKDCVLSEHNDWTGGNDEVGSLGITWEDREVTGNVAIMPSNKVNIIKWAAEHKQPRENRDQDFLPKQAHTRAFANKIRRYIQAQARSTVDREKYHGKLDKQAVVRLLMPPIDGGEWNKKIFYDQRKHTVKDTAIFVLVDWSGSMRGPKMDYAADAAQRLVHTFDRVLNIPVALAAFSNRVTTCDIGYIKQWNTRGMTAAKIAERFALMSNYTSGNDDADALNWAYHQILPRKETRKILIVLSDGAPAGSWRGHAADALKFVTSSIEKQGKVELYGVGIKSDAVAEYYTNNIYLRDENKINETLFTLIKEGNNVK